MKHRQGPIPRRLLELCGSAGRPENPELHGARTLSTTRGVVVRAAKVCYSSSPCCSTDFCLQSVVYITSRNDSTSRQTRTLPLTMMAAPVLLTAIRDTATTNTRRHKKAAMTVPLFMKSTQSLMPMKPIPARKAKAGRNLPYSKLLSPSYFLLIM